MNTFEYTAVDSNGKQFHGNIQEKSSFHAIQRVKEMGLYPTLVKELRPSVRPFHNESTFPAKTAKPVLGRISHKDLLAFTRQLGTLIESGIPIVKGLRSIAQQEENRLLKKVIHDIVADIDGGSMLSEALGRHPRTFNKLYISMIRAGEAAGTLELSLSRLADFMERAERIRARIVSAMFYPAAVITVAVGIFMVLAIYVIPRFKEVFADMTRGGGLPPFTQWVMNCSQNLRDHWISLFFCVLGCVAVIKLLMKTKTGRVKFDQIKLRMPVFGRISRKSAIARFARTLGTLLQSGVNILQALTIARETANNEVFARAIERTHERVKEGDALTPTLQACNEFPSTVISMVDVGEQSGALPTLLLKVADNYDDDVDAAISAALTLLEPALIVFLAVVVGSIVIALFLPLLNLVNGGVTNDEWRITNGEWPVQLHVNRGLKAPWRCKRTSSKLIGIVVFLRCQRYSPFSYIPCSRGGRTDSGTKRYMPDKSLAVLAIRLGYDSTEKTRLTG